MTIPPNACDFRNVRVELSPRQALFHGRSSALLKTAVAEQRKVHNSLVSVLHPSLARSATLCVCAYTRRNIVHRNMASVRGSQHHLSRHVLQCLVVRVLNLFLYLHRNYMALFNVHLTLHDALNADERSHTNRTARKEPMCRSQPLNVACK